MGDGNGVVMGQKKKGGKNIYLVVLSGKHADRNGSRKDSRGIIKPGKLAGSEYVTSGNDVSCQYSICCPPGKWRALGIVSKSLRLCIIISFIFYPRLALIRSFFSRSMKQFFSYPNFAIFPISENRALGEDEREVAPDVPRIDRLFSIY